MTDNKALEYLQSLNRISRWFAEQKTHPVNPSPKFTDDDVSNLVHLFDYCHISLMKSRIAMNEFSLPWEAAVKNNYAPTMPEPPGDGKCDTPAKEGR